MRRDEERKKRLIVGLYLLVILLGLGLGASFGYVQKMIPEKRVAPPPVFQAVEEEPTLEQITLDEEVPEEFYDVIEEAVKDEEIHLGHEAAVGATAGEDQDYIDSRTDLMDTLEDLREKIE
jgi:hypothetical protein